MNRPGTAWWSFLFLLASALILQHVFREGMFFDGLTYSSIARNLYIGEGSLWLPHDTGSLYTIFYEHPPFAFLLQRFFFTVLGDHYYVEKIYDAVCLLCSCTLIVAIVK